MLHHAYLGMMEKSSTIVVARSRRASPVLVCKKCLKRISGGHRVKRLLKSELKSRHAGSRVKPSRVVLTGCFGICPKRAVVIANATTLAQDSYLLLPGTDAIAEVSAMLDSGTP